ncbi:hypothetical protein GEMRC1_000310 [Eukaryota sp. GEM-RC1]
MIFYITNLNQLFILERLSLKDETFKQKYLNIDFLQSTPKVSFNCKIPKTESKLQSTVIINTPFENVFTLLCKLPPSYSYLFPDLTKWKFSTTACSFSTSSCFVSSLKQVVQLCDLEELFEFDSGTVIDNIIDCHDDVIFPYLESSLREFCSQDEEYIQNHTHFGDGFEGIFRLNLSPDLLVKMASFQDVFQVFCKVKSWRFGVPFGCLHPLLKQLSKFFGVLFSLFYNPPTVQYDYQCKLTIDFTRFLFDNNLMEDVINHFMSGKKSFGQI